MVLEKAVCIEHSMPLHNCTVTVFPNSFLLQAPKALVGHATGSHFHAIQHALDSHP